TSVCWSHIKAKGKPDAPPLYIYISVAEKGPPRGAFCTGGGKFRALCRHPVYLTLNPNIVYQAATSATAPRHSLRAQTDHDYASYSIFQIPMQDSNPYAASLPLAFDSNRWTQTQRRGRH